MNNKTVALCPNPFRDQDLAVTLQTQKLLEEKGFKTIISPVL